MITGIHQLMYSTAPDETRAFFRDVLKLSSVDAGHGWLIFVLPPAELGIHPVDDAQPLEMYLMCDDLDRAMAELKEKNVEITREPTQAGWGRVTAIRIPGGIEIGLYQPRHATALKLAAELAQGYIKES